MKIRIKVGDQFGDVDSEFLYSILRLLEEGHPDTRVEVGGVHFSYANHQISRGEVISICEKYGFLGENKIEAIKELRRYTEERTGLPMGLKEAKDWIEKFIPRR